MVIYTNLSASTGSPSVAAPPASGAHVSTSPAPAAFVSWEPSKWPQPPAKVNKGFIDVVRQIFEESMLGEIKNVIQDAKKVNGDLQHRGHVVAITMLCGVDTLSSYAFKDSKATKCPTCKRGDKVGPRYQRFIKDFFPPAYKVFAKDIYKLYRNSMVHSWNLFQATIHPGNEPVTKNKNGTLALGLENFFDALRTSAKNFLDQLETKQDLQENTLQRYTELRKTAR